MADLEVLLPTDIENLVFSGGGVRGLTYCAVLHELYSLTGFDFFSRKRKLKATAGTSIGSVFAVMVAAGYTPQELMQHADAFQIDHIMSVDITSLFSTWGFDNGSKLKKWIEDLLFTKTGKRNLTFKDLHEISNIHTTCVSVDLHECDPVYFNATNTPDVQICDAVAASMAIPPFFCPQKLVVNGRERMLIDGGFMRNFPVSIFPPEKTLGIRIKWDVAFNLNSMEQYYSRVIYCALYSSEESQWARLDDAYKPNIINVDVGDISTMNFRLPRAFMSRMLDNGRNAVKLFVASRMGGRGGKPRCDIGTSPGTADPCDGDILLSPNKGPRAPPTTHATTGGQ